MSPINSLIWAALAEGPRTSVLGAHLKKSSDASPKWLCKDKPVP